jgi:hypothetical protein
MARRVLSALVTAVVGGVLAGGMLAAPAVAQPQTQARSAPQVSIADVDFTGTVALSNCSGSVVRPPAAVDDDLAIVMTNGHCIESGMPSPGQVIVDQPSSRTFKLLSPAGDSTLGTLQATKVAYATMTDTDVTLYQLDTSYAAIQSQFGIRALDLSADHPTDGADIRVVSGYWKKIYSCNVDGFVYELHEAGWVWKDSLRYTSTCNVIGGTSGSPIIDVASGKVVGINNTGNENGQQCTLNNPCEVAPDGTVTVRQGTNYGEQTYLITPCVGAGNTIDLSQPDCALPKPAAVSHALR